MDQKHVSDTWERGSPYERYVGRWSRQVAPQFLSWLNIPAGRRWLDVGCGTGALCAAIVDRWLVDGVVDSIGRAPRWAGLLMRSLQTGLVQFYAVAMVLGVLVLLATRLL